MAHDPSGTRIAPTQVEWDQSTEVLEHFQTPLSRFVRGLVGNREDTQDIAHDLFVDAGGVVLGVPMSDTKGGVATS